MSTEPALIMPVICPHCNTANKMPRERERWRQAGHVGVAPRYGSSAKRSR